MKLLKARREGERGLFVAFRLARLVVGTGGFFRRHFNDLGREWKGRTNEVAIKTAAKALRWNAGRLIAEYRRHDTEE